VKYLATLCTSLRALMIAALAGGSVGGSSQAHAQGGDREAAEWNAARGIGTAAAFQQYLEQYPVGRYAGEAFRYIIELTVNPDAASDRGGPPAAGPEGPTRATRGFALDMY
jgi:hypothetical protein